MSSPCEAVSSWTRKRERVSAKSNDVELERVQSLLNDAGQNALRVARPIGDGTFSRVYLAKRADQSLAEESRVAVKCLVPTSSCDRVLTEIEALQRAQGKFHVISLLFFHRTNSRVILGMPYVRTDKFSDLLHIVDENAIKCYMKVLLEALAHVHRLGLIHRDVKPSNFLFALDQPEQAKLVDFGLAQKDPRALSSPMSLDEETSRFSLSHETPSSSSRSKRRRRSGLDEEANENSSPSKKRLRVTAQGDEGPLGLRRSPRKHLSSIAPNALTPARRVPGFSTLKISGSTIIGTNAMSPGSFNRNSSFTAIDPTSGIPSDSTPKLNASLTSRASLSSYFHRTPSLPPRRSTLPSSCKCLGRPRVCDTCVQRPQQKAARAGTPGFRPPEVLFKCDNQSTAVDMWGVGVILLSMMARAYPFFCAPDDYTALAELIAIFGTQAMQEAAQSYGKQLVCSEQLSGIDLGTLCRRLSNRGSGDINLEELNKRQELTQISKSAIDLLTRLLAPKQEERITAAEALQHSFFRDN